MYFLFEMVIFTCSNIALALLRGNYGAILYRLQDIATYWSKIVNFLAPLVLNRSLVTQYTHLGHVISVNMNDRYDILSCLWKIE